MMGCDGSRGDTPAAAALCEEPLVRDRGEPGGDALGDASGEVIGEVVAAEAQCLVVSRL